MKTLSCARGIAFWKKTIPALEFRTGLHCFSGLAQHIIRVIAKLPTYRCTRQMFGICRIVYVVYVALENKVDPIVSDVLILIADVPIFILSLLAGSHKKKRNLLSFWCPTECSVTRRNVCSILNDPSALRVLF